MASPDHSNAMSNFNGNAPVSTLQVLEFEELTGVHLPNEYSDFLQSCNGGEGFIGPNAYVIFWQLGELMEMNTAYEAEEYAPGLFLFGSDGGGDAFAFDMRNPSKPIVSVPFVGMELALAKPMGSSFPDFIEKLSGS